jgi:glutathione S-transferase
MIPKLYHHTICPFSRLLRCVLFEKNIDVKLIQEPFWERRSEFLQLNPFGQTPTIIHSESKFAISTIWVILEFLDEIESYNSNNNIINNNESVFGNTPETRAYNRFLLEWFCNKFYNEVTKYILNEKIIKTITRGGAPNSEAIRIAKKNLSYHIDYINYLLDDNKYITNDICVNVVDYAVASQISILDYVGDVLWKKNNKIKNWYALIKSYPAFSNILKDDILGLQCSKHYRNPDF